MKSGSLNMSVYFIKDKFLENYVFFRKFPNFSILKIRKVSAVHSQELPRFTHGNLHEISNKLFYVLNSILLRYIVMLLILQYI